ncbi:MAG TPA: creatininase [Synergistaceae bacterium]|jgi:creatinine amidohydrolase|nr:creatininase [Synergistaceae bacterium]
MKRLVVAEMTWPEVQRELDHVKVAVVPVGSCEQHGPNTTFTTDTDRAYEFCKLLGDRVGGKILIFPPFGYGISMHHMDFPATVTLRVETMIHALTDIAESIGKHGIKKILYVNGHGGNRFVLDAVVNTLKYEYGIEAYWSSMGTNLSRKQLSKEMDIPDVIGHACELETSQCLYLAPWLVKDTLEAGEIQNDSAYVQRLFKDGNAAWSWRYDVSANGALGDARKATAEIGKTMTDISLEYMERLLDEIIRR